MGNCCSSEGPCDKKKLVWECVGCGYRDPNINSNIPPDVCPDCGITADYFTLVESDSIGAWCF